MLTISRVTSHCPHKHGHCNQLWLTRCQSLAAALTCVVRTLSITPLLPPNHMPAVCIGHRKGYNWILTFFSPEVSSYLDLWYLIKIAWQIMKEKGVALELRSTFQLQTWYDWKWAGHKNLVHQLMQYLISMLFHVTARGITCAWWIETHYGS